MECRSCGASVPSTFKHAISKNECPGCGECLLDEESLALIEDISKTISNEATVRDETAHNLAVAIVAKYNISMDKSKIHAETKSEPKIKVAPPSPIKRAMGEDIVAPEVPEGITDTERDRIMEQAVKERYNIGVHIEDAESLENESLEDDVFVNGVPNVSFFSESNSILEKERLTRLAEQQKIIRGGGGSFRRSG